MKTDEELMGEKAENFERPSQPIGGEAEILNTTRAEQIEEEKLWAEYSMVKRGFGNGARNPLYLENLREENKRFGPLKAPYREHKPFKEPARKVRQDPTWIPVYQIDNHFDVEHDNTMFPVLKTRSDHPNSVVNRNWENGDNIYHPEGSLLRFKIIPIRTARWKLLQALNFTLSIGAGCKVIGLYMITVGVSRRMTSLRAGNFNSQKNKCLVRYKQK
jgi:hypothetical protein